ncbi:MAG: iron-containing alcohol dehydrogenase [Desulfobacula sp.]|jgi:alcohol dehydrogenase YqhD (iron-dependent ADH family)|uniref:iron-containing alcohol dehydrogenase n=1 Tax=Desulfobacula sp. TaxID=2593537 RepID=UPI001DDDF8DE|nr:iron-containing alcohol dehydrogenase [Desulfobacula sp.]MBT3487236.1 iron-containing alcohol dehydrogenase [Desulfobacula sp.]MBT3806813.1 iron-containing alcohol dehydrogenase [Desulfobacula sp.]MBT4027121.1 iron-containing alcohol dehydrogenase [Desulfobacula sp.]MBT4200861.1 iron-containing alcohol dehydrogenase [Desulfobacula sp.]
MLFNKVNKFLLIKLLAELINSFGKNLLLVTGGRSFKDTSQYRWLLNALKNNSAKIYCYSISSEPSPDMIDEIVRIYQEKNIHVVVAVAVAVGRGSVIDAGKKRLNKYFKIQALKIYFIVLICCRIVSSMARASSNC